MKKVIVAIAVVVSFIAIMVCSTAFADTRSSGDWTYNLMANGTAIITHFAGEGETIVVPPTLDGYQVTGIDDEAFKRESKSANSVYITLPESIITIGKFAFWNLNVNSINIPDSVQFIGAGAFVGSDKCKFRIDNNHSFYAVIDGNLYEKKQKILHTYMAVDAVAIPEGITAIGDYACYEHKNEAFFQLPATVTKIGDYAFYSARIRTNLEAFGNFESIGEKSFCKADIYIYSASGHGLDPMNFDVVKLSDKLLSLGDGAFMETDMNGGYVDISECAQLTRIPNEAFSGVFMGDSSIPTGILELGDMCFKNTSWYNMERLTIELPESVCIIGAEAFVLDVDILYWSGEMIEPVKIILPSSIESISEGFIPKNNDAYNLIVTEGSYAERWCQEHGYRYSLTDNSKQDLDWLNGD